MLNEILKTARKSKGMTQDDVALLLNVKRQTYSAYERGVSVPDAITLNKLASYFEVSTDYLLGETNDPSPKDRQSLTNTEAAMKLQKELAKLDIDIEDGKELETILKFIDSNKDMLKILMKKDKE